MPFTIHPDHLDSLARGLSPYLSGPIKPHVDAAVREMIEPYDEPSDDDGEPSSEGLLDEAEASGMPRSGFPLSSSSAWSQCSLSVWAPCASTRTARCRSS
jgi:hypothetical protein